MYLLDTNVISELRKIRPHRAVVEWVSAIKDADLHLSVVTLAEIQAGIEVTRMQDEAKAAEIEAWLNKIAETYNVLPTNASTFRLWAKLMHRKSNTIYEDAMIAATALTHKLRLVTRNVRDFKSFGVDILNPFALD